MIIHLSAKHIAIKRDQDRTACDGNKVIICDGIGQFPDSDKAAEITIENIKFAERGKTAEIIGLIHNATKEIKESNIVAGTTLIAAFIDETNEITKIKLAYIGNGSIFHFHGNFNELPISYSDVNKPYLFSNILIPHIDKEGILLRHISHDSGIPELIPSFIELSLTGLFGDIIFMFSDGISSLEDDIIVQDEHHRVWRNQSENVSIIINNLHLWLVENCTEVTRSKMDLFLENELYQLKDAKKLEDDASIGLIITEDVLTYYRETYV
jgi:hypothetical protein